MVLEHLILSETQFPGRTLVARLGLAARNSCKTRNPKGAGRVTGIVMGWLLWDRDWAEERIPQPPKENGHARHWLGLDQAFALVILGGGGVKLAPRDFG